MRVQAAADRDALALEQVDLAARGDLEARAEGVDRADHGRVGERLGREVDLRLGQLAAERQQLGGHAIDVEHEERTAVLAHQVGEADARGVGGELPSRELAVRRLLGRGRVVELRA